MKKYLIVIFLFFNCSFITNIDNEKDGVKISEYSILPDNSNETINNFMGTWEGVPVINGIQKTNQLYRIIMSSKPRTMINLEMHNIIYFDDSEITSDFGPELRLFDFENSVIYFSTLGTNSHTTVSVGNGNIAFNQNNPQKLILIYNKTFLDGRPIDKKEIYVELSKNK